METIRLFVKNNSKKPETITLFTGKKYHAGRGKMNSEDIEITAPGYEGGYEELERKSQEEGLDIFRVYSSQSGYASVTTLGYAEDSSNRIIHIVPPGMDKERKSLWGDDPIYISRGMVIVFFQPINPGEEVVINLILRKKNPYVYPLVVENKSSEPQRFSLFNSMKNRGKENFGNPKGVEVTTCIWGGYSMLLGINQTLPIFIRGVYCSHPGTLIFSRQYDPDITRQEIIVHAHRYPEPCIWPKDYGINIIDAITEVIPLGWTLAPGEKVEIDFELLIDEAQKPDIRHSLTDLNKPEGLSDGTGLLCWKISKAINFIQSAKNTEPGNQVLAIDGEQTADLLANLQEIKALAKQIQYILGIPLVKIKTSGPNYVAAIKQIKKILNREEPEDLFKTIKAKSDLGDLDKNDSCFKDYLEVHVFFYALPMETKFIHRGEVWQKTGEEEAEDSNFKKWRFESHYGCIIEKKEAERLNISEKDYRPIYRNSKP